jgi:hypothetical protein
VIGRQTETCRQHLFQGDLTAERPLGDLSERFTERSESGSHCRRIPDDIAGHAVCCRAGLVGAGLHLGAELVAGGGGGVVHVVELVGDRINVGLGLVGVASTLVIQSRDESFLASSVTAASSARAAPVSADTSSVGSAFSIFLASSSACLASSSS